MIERIYDVAPKVLCDELLRVCRLKRNWLKVKFIKDGEYAAHIQVATWMPNHFKAGGDYFAMFNLGNWLMDGPKTFRPTEQQCRALEQVEVTLPLEDYAQPYPALLVELPKDYAPPFVNVLCGLLELQDVDGPGRHKVACFNLHTSSHRDEIVTTISIDGRPMEESIQTYDNDCQAQAKQAGRALRVAVNSCLALVNYGDRKRLLLPHEADRDNKLAKEQTERGQRARERLANRPLVELVAFEQDILLHQTSKHLPGEPTGREMPCHWRRGHWRMTPCGTGRQERRRTLIKPVLVRADLFGGDKSDTSAVYH